MPSESQSYATAHAAARTCLATLAQTSTDSRAMIFRELLLALDDLHKGATPQTYPLIAAPAELLLWLESAVRRMIAAGGDADSLELILKRARCV